MLRECVCVCVWGGGWLSESVEKGKFVKKLFFQMTLNKVLEICEKLYLLL